MNHLVLMLPGLGNSDEGHWQSIWQAESSVYQRVEQDSWNNPNLDDWLPRLSQHIERQKAPIFLVAHSLGCALVAHYVSNHDSQGNVDPHKVYGAMLVSPADVDDIEAVPPEVSSFAPMPLDPFPFPSIVVASNDDPYVKEERAQFFAAKWGSEFFSAGAKGHITTESGFGEWKEGRDHLNELVARRMIERGASNHAEQF